MPRSPFRQILKNLAPKLYERASAVWCRHMDRRYRDVEAKVIARFGLKVADGPFMGMTYGSQAFCSGLAPKIIGCYEDELSEVWKQVLRIDYSLLIDIGCAEGYYAVGLARSFPGKTVYAFDCDSTARRLCADLARANSASEQIVLGGACGIKELRALPLRGAFLMCDCEGCELELLRPEAVPELQHCDILVELHDFMDTQISPQILARFASSHHVTLVASTRRDPARYPQVNFLRPADQVLAVSDRRAEPVQWAFFIAKNR